MAHCLKRKYGTVKRQVRERHRDSKDSGDGLVISAGSFVNIGRWRGQSWRRSLHFERGLEGLIAAPLPDLWSGIHPLGYLQQTIPLVEAKHGTAGDGDDRAIDGGSASQADPLPFWRCFAQREGHVPVERARWLGNRPCQHTSAADQDHPAYCPRKARVEHGPVKVEARR